jgi:hypothetical protein
MANGLFDLPGKKIPSWLQRLHDPTWTGNYLAFFVQTARPVWEMVISTGQAGPTGRRQKEAKQRSSVARRHR